MGIPTFTHDTLMMNVLQGCCDFRDALTVVPWTLLWALMLRRQA